MQKTVEIDNAKIFNKLFCELEDCDEEEKKQKFIEMNKIIDRMTEEEFYSVFTKEMFNKIQKMLEKSKISLGDSLFMLKHVGYCNVPKRIWNFPFDESSLNKRFEKMIFDENEKIEEKNEKLLVDLCECYVSLSNIIFDELLSICVPCLVKVALRKEESEEARNEVEIAFLALYSIGIGDLRQELYLSELKEIIKYHQEQYNLTWIAYQSAWKFLIERLSDKSLKEVIVDELLFAREAARELEKLTKCVNCERKEEKRGKESKEKACFEEMDADIKHLFWRVSIAE
ncbi:uncharacterized protein MONOS_17188 [Monocercomonoides exilis]|uniref:uncharacterized protein n=1 Tax=Monocercomonoides exilis TaxID=2049356 RepID=UPI00355A09A5|nr:hypothetical protein MONOS_17188 [Monocercomonoides exilis]